LRDLARRLEDKGDIPLTLDPPQVFPKVGEQQTFWVTNMDNDQNFKVDANLEYVGDNLYFWIEKGVKFNKNELDELAQTFDKNIYAVNHEFFGSEFKPGIDGDPRLYILMAGGLGSSIAGYFSSVDSFSAQAHEYSNEHEMIFINADTVNLGDEFTYGVLAHEFQHMIHWYHDRNEDTWMNEGFSELAAFLNGYGAGGFEYSFINNPDMQLTYWPDGDSDTSPYYGAAFMFTNYFLGRFGEKASQSLVNHTDNGMTSVDTVLNEIDAVDAQTGKKLGADDVFQDWTIANYLNDASVGDGRYTYAKYPNAPTVDDTEEIERCPTEMETRDVHQYGADYVKITCPGKYTLHFEGSTQVKILPTDAASGIYAFWSNRGDDSNMSLTRTFDFSAVSAPIQMNYSTWFDLEENYDYLYLLASEDGERWSILKTPSGTNEDPSGNSYGWGYNAKSGGGAEWIVENVDLSQFAGKKVQLRFEYVTDAAVNGEGFFVDDVSIPQIHYSTDFEEDDGGWEAQGFVRVENILPQSFRLALIHASQPTQVQYLNLSADNALDVPFEVGGEIKDVVLVVSGTTRFTNQKAAYRFQILK